MSEELMPCPHCGGEADVHHFAHDDSECTVMCSNPNCRASVSARSCGSMTTAYNRARKLWNRRAERTCHNFGGEEGTVGEGYDFACSACGWCGDVTEPNYCLNCGAKVVSE